MNNSSSFPYTDILKTISKPLRYVGGEPGAIVKTGNLKSSIVLAFPDVYEIGMSHLGIRILYNKVNSIEGYSAERVFAPWPDMEKELREKNLPLVSQESRKPLNDFPVVGFSLQFELNFTNILLMLDLGDIPLLREERTDKDPLVIAGGPVVLHAEPISDFIDIFFIGDGENLLPWFLEEEYKLREKNVSREERIRILAMNPHLYAPATRETILDPVNNVVVLKEDSKYPYPITVEHCDSIDEQPSPVSGPVPHIAIFERAALEIARGCNQGCRFCQAGFIYRPFRERAPDALLKDLENALSQGYDEISLTALSTLDYCGFPKLLDLVSQRVREEKASIAISSMRAYDLPDSVLENLRTGRAGGLTFAPEAGTQRLRDVINKNISEEDLFETVKKVSSLGWSRIKLYFMSGLPTETDEDLEAISELAYKVHLKGKDATQGKPPKVTCSVSNFIPKPHTPFQWCKSSTMLEIKRNHDVVWDSSRGKKVNVKFPSPKDSYLEGVIARGDRTLGKVILKAYELGARFDGWRDWFDLQTWMRAFEEVGVEPDNFTKEFDMDGRLPWDHFDTGVSVEFLKNEYEKCLKAQPTKACLELKDDKISCVNCGAKCDLKTHANHKRDFINYLENKSFPVKEEIVNENKRVMITYSKYGDGLFFSHLDLLKHLPRILRSAGIKPKYSQGFNPRPQLSFTPALPQDMESNGELIELHILGKINDFAKTLKLMNENSPAGIEYKSIENLSSETKPLSIRLTGAEYIIDLGGFDFNKVKENLNNIKESEEFFITRYRKTKKPRKFDIKESIDNLVFNSETGILTFEIKEIKTIAVKATEILTILLPEQPPESIKIIRNKFFLS
jgi:radical SAM family uncharacterized protein/radical SAM-linked protein